MEDPIQKVTELVAQIAVASQEQATGVRQINTSLGQIDNLTQQNAATAEECAATAAEQQNQINRLRAELARLAGGRTPDTLPPERRLAEPPGGRLPA